MASEKEIIEKYQRYACPGENVYNESGGIRRRATAAQLAARNAAAARSTKLTRRCRRRRKWRPGNF